MEAPGAPRRVRRIVEIVDNRDGLLTTRVYAECDYADAVQTVFLLPERNFSAEDTAVMMETVHDMLAIPNEKVEAMARDQYVAGLVRPKTV